MGMAWRACCGRGAGSVQAPRFHLNLSGHPAREVHWQHDRWIVDGMVRWRDILPRRRTKVEVGEVSQRVLGLLGAKQVNLSDASGATVVADQELVGDLVEVV